MNAYRTTPPVVTAKTDDHPYPAKMDACPFCGKKKFSIAKFCHRKICDKFTHLHQSCVSCSGTWKLKPFNIEIVGMFNKHSTLRKMASWAGIAATGGVLTELVTQCLLR